MEGVAEGNLSERTIETDDRYVTTVMLVSGGYPGDYKKGMSIDGLDKIAGSVAFHAGTKLSGGNAVTSGGRVLAISSWGKTKEEALKTSYRNASAISFENMYYRKDIGFDLEN